METRGQKPGDGLTWGEEKSKDYIYLFIYYFTLLASHVPVTPRCHDIHALLNGLFVGRFFVLRAKRKLISTECCHAFVLCRIICLMPTISSA
jgi:hypothetical protein